MMLLLALPTFAALPWECPTITEPSDAAPYRDLPPEVAALGAHLAAASEPYRTAPCEWVVTSSGEDLSVSVEERACVAPGFTVTETERQESYGDAWDMTREVTTTVIVEVADGAPWTRIETTSFTSVDRYGTRREETAAWVGSVEGLPDDASYTAASGATDTSRFRTVRTSGCTYRWSLYDDGYDATESVTLGETTVSVFTTTAGWCSERRAVATQEGTRFGLVDPETWVHDPADADRDGFAAGACDCDDADPTRNTGAFDVPYDGLDQDCDGGDRTDADGDGHDAAVVGGDDCDDEDADVFGGAAEVECDGVDQDCDGADLCADDATAEAPPDEPPAEDTAAVEAPAAATPDERAGCAGAAAWLLVLPLFASRRRPRRD